MKRTVVATVAAALVACTAGDEPRSSQTPRGDPTIVLGGQLKKSFVRGDNGVMVSFQIDVSNEGTGPGSAENISCHVTVEGRRYPLTIFQNPELAPGETGWLRAGVTLPEAPSGAVADDLEPDCDL